MSSQTSFRDENRDALKKKVGYIRTWFLSWLFWLPPTSSPSRCVYLHGSLASEIISNVKTIQFPLIADPCSLGVRFPASGCLRLCQRLTGALRPFRHICFLAASASIRSHPSLCSCMQGWRWGFPALIRASRMFSVQGRWAAQPINMLGQRYQTVSLLRVIDDGPSTLSQQTS